MADRHSIRRALALTLLLWLGLGAAAQNAADMTMRDFERLGLQGYAHNQATILPTGEIKFQDMFEAVERAEYTICMDYFKFQQDSICGELLERLCRKAQQGVAVRILYDSFGNSNSDLPLTKPFLEKIRRTGVRIEGFDPVRFPWVNHLLHRDHHKIAIIDGSLVYTGGMNVADYYLHGKPQVGEWRDMHIRMSGPVVAAYADLFCRMWQRTTGETLTPGMLVGKAPSMDWQSTDATVFFADRWPRITPAIMRQTYCAAIDNAQHLVQIVNPYAMLFGSVRRSLRNALKRGVKVQFMVSTVSDGKTNDDITGLEMYKLMQRGAEVYFYNGGFHHSKVMMVDSLFCTVGTTNLDARSLCFDYEVNAFLFDPVTTHILQGIFADDVARRCDLLTPELWKQRFPRARRIRCHISQIAKRVM